MTVSALSSGPASTSLIKQFSWIFQYSFPEFRIQEMKACSRMATSTKPFTIKANRVRKSPFKTVAKTLKAKRMFSQGKRIGFTMRSSLKSMGLIPRSSGLYVLGPKYEGF